MQTLKLNLLQIVSLRRSQDVLKPSNLSRSKMMVSSSQRILISKTRMRSRCKLKMMRRRKHQNKRSSKLRRSRQKPRISSKRSLKPRSQSKKQPIGSRQAESHWKTMVDGKLTISRLLPAIYFSMKITKSKRQLSNLNKQKTFGTQA